VLHSQFEEQVLASRCTHGQQGENRILDQSRIMAVYSHAFGLCNAPVTFKRLMETVLQGLTYDLCLVYSDDVIIIGRTFQEDLANLQKVFQWFREACLKLYLEKCQSPRGSSFEFLCPLTYVLMYTL
jgi:hypothetical protein